VSRTVAGRKRSTLSKPGKGNSKTSNEKKNRGSAPERRIRIREKDRKEQKLTREKEPRSELENQSGGREARNMSISPRYRKKSQKGQRPLGKRTLRFKKEAITTNAIDGQIVRQIGPGGAGTKKTYNALSKRRGSKQSAPSGKKLTRRARSCRESYEKIRRGKRG